MNDVVEKYCSGCDRTLSIESFGNDRSRRDGKNSRCKECHRAKSAAYYERNPERCRAATNQWRERNKEELNATYREQYAENPEFFRGKSKAWRDNNPEKSRESVRGWRERNPEQVKEYARRYREENVELYRWHDQKRRTTPKGKLENSVRSRLWKELTKGSKIGRRTFDLLGYTVDDLKCHIESQFFDGMTWDNYRHDVWHIDHVRPLASFNYETPDDPEFREAWALSNLRPLWAIDNMRKGAKWDGPAPANDNELVGQEQAV